MIRSGGHRVRVVSRWVALPVFAILAVGVAYATYSGAPWLLRVAAVAALVVGVGLVLMFDGELIRARRTHAADRAALADSYAKTYAAHIRVTSPMQPAAPTTRNEDVARNGQAVRAASTALGEPTDARPTDAPIHTPTDAPPVVLPVAAGAPGRELWAGLQDAPTVVDLIAWEERNRLSTGSGADPITDVKGWMPEPVDRREDAVG